uniref:H/ACA ribonucleoprotein complex subunit n=1 Tax=Meloidogyne hapla TaxID=6305 RepID=A0A1I8BKV6_MELHA
MADYIPQDFTTIPPLCIREGTLQFNASKLELNPEYDPSKLDSNIEKLLPFHRDEQYPYWVGELLPNTTYKLTDKEEEYIELYYKIKNGVHTLENLPNDGGGDEAAGSGDEAAGGGDKPESSHQASKRRREGGNGNGGNGNGGGRNGRGNGHGRGRARHGQ